MLTDFSLLRRELERPEFRYVVADFRLNRAFRQLDTLPPIVSLDIPDEYIFMQRELIDLLGPAVESAIENYRAEQAAAAAEDSA